ncbi:MAG: hypothetical protein ACRDBG_02600 [Waterburya sp.]
MKQDYKQSVIGVLCLYGIDYEKVAYDAIYNYDVTMVLPIKPVPKDVKILVMPDTGKFDGARPCFLPGIAPYEIEGDSAFESLFLNYYLGEFYNRGGKIVGFGSSCANLWDRLLNGKIVAGSGIIEEWCLIDRSGQKALVEDDLKEFRTNQLAGSLRHYSHLLLQQLVSHLEKMDDRTNSRLLLPS